MTISVIGLGKLGASMAAAMASRGLAVIGYDSNPKVIAALADGRAPVVEPQLQELITQNRSRIRATSDLAEAVAASSFSFIVVPTPSMASGAFSLTHAKAACEGIGRALAGSTGPHHVVLCSTVQPGSCRGVLIPALEQSSGKQCGPGFNFAYNPEFIALGSVIRDFLQPDFTLIGEPQPGSAQPLEDLYQRLLLRPAPCRRMSLENAELAKILVNAYVTTKISFANMVADLCEGLPGGDARAICDALGTDARIGRKYLNGGPSFGGPCFPRDNQALAAFARDSGIPVPLPLATIQSNRELHERVASAVLARAPAGSAVAVLGLAYKPDSNVVEESPGVELCRRLTNAGRSVFAFDPLANEMARAVVPTSVTLCASATECIGRAPVVVVTSPDAAFRTLETHHWAPAAGIRIIFDLWDCLPSSISTAAGVEVIRRGRGRGLG